ncbi:hypothetical protein AMTRI_Chr01g111820 [Amborella trichopoda]
MGIRTLLSRTFRRVLLLFLLFPVIFPVSGLGFAGIRQFQTLVSLSSSLMTRVANARASRGDIDGSARARRMAEMLNGRMGFSGGVWSMAWDYAQNYAWRGGDFRPSDLFEAAKEMEEITRAFSQVSGTGTQLDKPVWVSRNYERILGAFKSFFKRLLLRFTRSGPLREAILVLQREVAEGDLLRDCMEVSMQDLNAVVKLGREMMLHYFSHSPNHSDL